VALRGPTRITMRDAVIFDVDGVLVDSTLPHFLSWRALVEQGQRQGQRKCSSIVHSYLASSEAAGAVGLLRRSVLISTGFPSRGSQRISEASGPPTSPCGRRTR